MPANCSPASLRPARHRRKDMKLQDQLKWNFQPGKSMSMYTTNSPLKSRIGEGGVTRLFRLYQLASRQAGRSFTGFDNELRSPQTMHHTYTEVKGANDNHYIPVILRQRTGQVHRLFHFGYKLRSVNLRHACIEACKACLQGKSLCLGS